MDEFLEQVDAFDNGTYYDMFDLWKKRDYYKLLIN
jgi:hypothetical protein